MGFLILLFLFIAVPVLEISLLIKVGGSIGGFNTIAFVILTAALGAYLVRQQGFATIQKLQQETQAGRIPALQIAEGVALLFAGAVLLTPGFLTDAVGFALLIPFVRRLIIAFIASKYSTNGTGFSYSAHSSSTQSSQQRHEGGPSIIEGEYTDSASNKHSNTNDNK